MRPRREWVETSDVQRQPPSVRPQDHVDVGGVLDERSEALLATDVCHQELLGHGLLAQLPVRRGQSVQAKSAEEEHQQDQRPDGDEEVQVRSV